jgi:hypothetical protein
MTAMTERKLMGANFCRAALKKIWSVCADKPPNS